VIRVFTPAGVYEFDEADAFGTGAEARVTRDSPLTLWKLDPEKKGNHKRLAVFAPGGWSGLEFKGDAKDLGSMGFQAPKSSG
jgi:hypothetical protein